MSILSAFRLSWAGRAVRRGVIVSLGLCTSLVGCGPDQGALVDEQEPLGQFEHGVVVANNDFETGPAAPGGSITVYAGDTSVPGWTIGGNSIDYVTTYWKAADGIASIDLNGTGAGVLSQTVQTVPGQTYRIAFWLAGNVVIGPTVKQLRVEAAGTYRDFTFDVTGCTGSNMGWVRRYHPFVATGYTTTITFRSLTNDWGGAALDGILVYAI